MEPEILFTTLDGQTGNIAIITLNRPKMLNALTMDMCVAMYAKLQEWEQDERIKAIVIKGAGERAFCAGGDIRAVYELREQPQLARQFFWHEYRLNHRIHHLQKPYIALLDGITMGGGAGLSVNGRFRLATEKLKFAMPETGIGFFPDVGGSYFLPRLRDHIGIYLALTGAVIGVADAFYAGLIDAQIPSADIPAVLQALLDAKWNNADLCVTASEAINRFAVATAAPELALHAEIIAHCFAQTEVTAILTCLNQRREIWAQEVATLLSSRAPTSLKVVLEQMRRGSQLSFDACMQMEYRMTKQFLQTQDFFEGVRAAVVDKDRNPHWQPNHLAAITEQQVAQFFVAIPEELDFK